MKYIYLILLLFLTLTTKLVAQCTSMPAEPACSGTLLTNNANLTTGTYYANGGTFTGISISGATLKICSGTNNISFSGFNNGTVYILTGSILNLSLSNIPSGMAIYNYGTLNFSSGLSINSSSGFINTGTINVTGNMTGNSCTLTNRGTINITGTLGDWQNSGGICMHTNSKIATANISWTSIDNWVSSPSGISCISYTGSATGGNSHPFTNTSNTNICRNSSASARTGTGTWGSATVTNSCSSCSNIILPVDYLFFRINNSIDPSVLEWSTAQEENNKVFEIESSTDGVNFNKIGENTGNGTTNSVSNYKYSLAQPSNTIEYYRLKQIDFNGLYEYSKIISRDQSNNINSMEIFPNPFQDETDLTIIFDDYLTTGFKVNIFDISGKKLNTINIEHKEFDKSYSIEKTYFDLPKGIYFLEIQTEHSEYNNKIEIK